MTPKGENREMLNSLFSRLISEHGDGIGHQVIRAIVEELGGLQIRVPSIGELDREARDQRICNLFNGFNTMELAIRFGLSTRQIRRIVRNQATVERNS